MADVARLLAVLERFVRALNNHDLEELVSCFHRNYRSDQPAHPERSFRGRDRLAENWEWVFDSFDDFRAELCDYAVRDDTIWTEWRWVGTGPHGESIDVRGVIIFGIEGNVFRWGRLYLEPVDEAT